MNREELEVKFQKLYGEAMEKEALLKILVLSSSSELLESMVNLMQNIKQSAFDCARGYQ